MAVVTPTVASVVTGILDRVETELENNRVPAEIWNNEAIFRAELDQVFGTCYRKAQSGSRCAERAISRARRCWASGLRRSRCAKVTSNTYRSTTDPTGRAIPTRR